MPFREKYIHLLTDFGFKRVFGSEPNKALLIDFLNTLLPPHHQIQNLTFKNTEHLGSTPLDRKAIFDIYCQGDNGERFIVEVQKAKQINFKDRSIYYSTFPIQEQSEQGEWSYKLTPVYTVAVLDFLFEDHKNEEEYLHIVELKDQHGKVFYPRLKYIYIELPKFTKTLEELDSHLEKWLYVFRHLGELTEPPELLESDVIFNQLLEVAKIANFSTTEWHSYQNSLKHYRDLHNVIATSREEGWLEGRRQGLEEGKEQGRRQSLEENLQWERSLILRQLSRTLGEIPQEQRELIKQLPLNQLEQLGEELLDFASVDDLRAWLNQI